MKQLAMAVALLSMLLASGSVGAAADRDATREELRATLETGGQMSDVNVTFRQSTKNPYNFVGSMTEGIKNADSLEIVVSVTKSDTIGFRFTPTTRPPISTF
ncbi:MAG: hypothetical protein M3N19_06700 [Candidatus Eremiobacteraeota bacterium]|nr:hypothetical protein [Candidatus Eremiobacteraeota bacterium]